MTAPMTPDEARLRELAEAATPGPWHLSERGFKKDGNRPSVYHCGDDLNYIANCADFLCFHEQPRNLQNAAFIAAANPATILALLDALSAERERVADMQRRLDMWEPKPTSGSSIAVSSRIGGNNAPLATQKAEGA